MLAVLIITNMVKSVVFRQYGQQKRKFKNKNSCNYVLQEFYLLVVSPGLPYMYLFATICSIITDYQQYTTITTQLNLHIKVNQCKK